jgi:outer membrane protein TolC
VAVGEALTQLEELERVVGEYVDRQVALEGDRLAVQTERARAEQARLSLRNQEATLKEQLNLLLGRPLATPFTVEALPETGSDEVEADAAVARALRDRPAVRQAAINVQRAEQALTLQQRERLPDVSLAFGMVRLFNVDVLPSTVAAASVLFTWQPLDWGRRRHEAAQRGVAIEQAKLAQDEARARVELDVRARIRHVAESREQLRVARLARDTAAERLRVATDRYRADAALLRDVLEAQTALARATQEYQQALGGFWTARADLEQAIGDQP